MSYSPDPDAIAINAFSLDWASLKFYAFPPFCHVISPEQNGNQSSRGHLHSTKLANTSLVPERNTLNETEAHYSTTRKKPSSFAQPPQGSSPTAPKATATGLPLIGQKLESSNLSSSAQNIIMSSWRSGTIKQYKSYLERWEQFCIGNNVSVFEPDIGKVIEFLTELFHTGKGYSAINTARSALSSIILLPGGRPVGEHPLICRFLKGVFELRPALPKYTEILDVGIVLRYLKTLCPP